MKFRKPRVRKLKLQRESLRRLTRPEMSRVVGGRPSVLTICESICFC